jgi:hypothetical protein
LLKDYVNTRLKITQHPVSQTELIAAVDRSNALQEALWQQAITMAARDNARTGLFIQTLNEMIDNQAKRLAALRNRVPNIVPLALFGIAAVAGAFAGYGSGLETRRTRLPVYIMGFLVSTIILSSWTSIDLTLVSSKLANNR